MVTVSEREKLLSKYYMFISIHLRCLFISGMWPVGGGVAPWPVFWLEPSSCTFTYIARSPTLVCHPSLGRLVPAALIRRIRDKIERQLRQLMSSARRLYSTWRRTRNRSSFVSELAFSYYYYNHCHRQMFLSPTDGRTDGRKHREFLTPVIHPPKKIDI